MFGILMYRKIKDTNRLWIFNRTNSVHQINQKYLLHFFIFYAWLVYRTLTFPASTMIRCLVLSIHNKERVNQISSYQERPAYRLQLLLYSFIYAFLDCNNIYEW